MKILLALLTGMALCGNDPDPEERPRMARELPEMLYALMLPLSLAAAAALLFILAVYSWPEDPFPAFFFTGVGAVSVVLFIATLIRTFRKRSA